MENSEFKKGQRVKIKDEETGEIINGTVQDITPDCVIIKWEDLTDPVNHDKSEYHLISSI